jgi:hypothetical protein
MVMKRFLKPAQAEQPALEPPDSKESRELVLVFEARDRINVAIYSRPGLPASTGVLFSSCGIARSFPTVAGGSANARLRMLFQNRRVVSDCACSDFYKRDSCACPAVSLEEGFAYTQQTCGFSGGEKWLHNCSYR